jgi:hypothetical protein
VADLLGLLLEVALGLVPEVGLGLTRFAAGGCSKREGAELVRPGGSSGVAARLAARLLLSPVGGVLATRLSLGALGGGGGGALARGV